VPSERGALRQYTGLRREYELRDELVTLLCMLATAMLALGDDRLAE